MDSTNTISDHTANSSPEMEPTRRERFAAFNKRLASKCYSFGGVAFLMFFLMLASGECDDEGPTEPGCDPTEETVTPPPVVTPDRSSPHRS